MSNCCERSGGQARRQRGDVLVEALIGVLLTGILGAGMAHIAARIAVGQHDAKIENLAVERLRNQLQSRGIALCEEKTLPLQMPGRTVASISCAGAQEVNVTVDGQARQVAAPPEILLQVAAVGAPALAVGTRQLAQTPP